jgi:hypothetical protein
MAITTSISNSFKTEILMGGHCFAATLSSLVGAGVNAAFTITGLATTAGIAVGMAAGGTNVAAGAIVASVDSATQVTVSKAHTGTVTSGTISFTGDLFKFALIKVGASTTYNNGQTNIGTPGSGTPGTANLGTDECPATGGYASGGFSLTNVTPVLSTNTAVTTFSPSPSYTSATISTIGAIIWNTGVAALASARLGGAATPIVGRTVGCFDFGGTQSVASGTITFTMPSAVAGTAIIQIS